MHRASASRVRPPRRLGCAMSKAGNRTPHPAMGYQPGLDGLRAISVIAVIFYHAGFTWMHGGFFGVEVFFVVSGFLITSLLIEERGRSGAVSMRQFWMRRIRRLFRRSVRDVARRFDVDRLFGTAEQASQMRRDLPWSIFYVANWGQILGDVPYFQSGDPPLLRHLWSLAVEEQWYLLWPLAFVLLMRSGWGSAVIAKFLLGLVAVVMIVMWWVQRGVPAADGRRSVRRGRPGQLQLSVDDHASRRLVDGCRGGVRMAAVAIAERSPSPEPPTRPGDGHQPRAVDLRLHRCPTDRGLHVPVVVDGRVGAVVGRRARGRASRRSRIAADPVVDASGRDRQTQLWAVPLALADLRDRRRDPRLGAPVPRSLGCLGNRGRGVLSLCRDAGPTRCVEPVVAQPEADPLGADRWCCGGLRRTHCVLRVGRTVRCGRRRRRRRLRIGGRRYPIR